MLPPCITKESNGVLDQSSHPHRVPITARLLTPQDKGNGKGPRPKAKAKASAVVTAEKTDKKDAKDDTTDDKKSTVAAVVPHTFTFYVNPEWTQPTVVADAAGVTTKDDDAGEATGDNDKSDAKDTAPVPTNLSWVWPEDKTLSMHPCWAVRRVDPKANAHDNLICNMGWEDKMFTDICVGMVAGESFSETVEVTIPMLVNTQHVGMHQELLLETCIKKASNKREHTWQDHANAAVQKIANEQKKAKKQGSVLPTATEI